jgi:hypothetical protein
MTEGERETIESNDFKLGQNDMRERIAIFFDREAEAKKRNG